jgi:putative salt-induced outer membrane protein YdiY
MRTKRIWPACLAAIALVVCAYAQTPEPAAESPAVKNRSQADLRLVAPDMWGLPPVPQPESLAPFAGNVAPPAPPPVALVHPPTETLPTPPPNAPPKNSDESHAFSEAADQSKAAEIVVLPEWKLWSGSFDLGLDGSEGNTQAMNFRFGFHAQRKTDFSVLTLGVDYNKRDTQNETTTDRLFFDGRYERLLGHTRWSLFIHETIEYDQFQPFDSRDTTDVGLGYRLIKNDTTTLIGRIGGGFSHEYGGPESGRYVPEAVFGLQFERQLNNRQKLFGSVDYAPDVTNFGQYRIRTQAAWEMLLDSQRNLSLRLGVLERYNSLYEKDKPNDLDYALMLLWKF